MSVNRGRWLGLGERPAQLFLFYCFVSQCLETSGSGDGSAYIYYSGFWNEKCLITLKEHSAPFISCFTLYVGLPGEGSLVAPSFSRLTCCLHLPNLTSAQCGYSVVFSPLIPNSQRFSGLFAILRYLQTTRAVRLRPGSCPPSGLHVRSPGGAGRFYLGLAAACFLSSVGDICALLREGHC